jgi:hypothetical protein
VAAKIGKKEKKNMKLAVRMLYLDMQTIVIKKTKKEDLLGFYNVDC